MIGHHPQEGHRCGLPTPTQQVGCEEALNWQRGGQTSCSEIALKVMACSPEPPCPNRQIRQSTRRKCPWSQTAVGEWGTHEQGAVPPGGAWETMPQGTLLRPEQVRADERLQSRPPVTQAQRPERRHGAAGAPRKAAPWRSYT